MTDTFRALCAELLAALKSWSPHGGGPLQCWEDREEEAALIARAEALLAQPEPVAPTDEDLEDLAEVMNVSGNPVPAMRRALQLWGNSDSSPQPVWADIHYAWELEDAEGEWQAGGSANSLDDVHREGSRYLQTYLQDGPHKLIIQIIQRHCVNTIEEVTND
jgi:hypothetical protein